MPFANIFYIYLHLLFDAFAIMMAPEPNTQYRKKEKEEEEEEQDKMKKKKKKNNLKYGSKQPSPPVCVEIICIFF